MKLHPSITETKPCAEVTIVRLRQHYRAILEQEQGRGILPDEQRLLDQLK